jgi:hypothetical protein
MKAAVIIAVMSTTTIASCGHLGKPSCSTVELSVPGGQGAAMDEQAPARAASTPDLLVYSSTVLPTPIRLVTRSAWQTHSPCSIHIVPSIDEHMNINEQSWLARVALPDGQSRYRQTGSRLLAMTRTEKWRDLAFSLPGGATRTQATVEVWKETQGARPPDFIETITLEWKQTDESPTKPVEDVVLTGMVASMIHNLWVSERAAEARLFRAKEWPTDVTLAIHVTYRASNGDQLRGSLVWYADWKTPVFRFELDGEVSGFIQDSNNGRSVVCVIEASPALALSDIRRTKYWSGAVSTTVPVEVFK